ncbi:SirB2 family protein [Pelistega sp. NLN82]|uniref:SirB2 family protein n=1 Tax=Pelistega ratti TaxID=2652177 RepID=A0A6L9Y6Z7_9BURK|nr:SirB2 family protein [Pelistega ratti]NEN76262.1 SirB2 family protein [Pelistega ratti]
MAEYYLTIKSIHMSCAYLSISLLLLRIFLSVYRPALLEQATLKYLPHVIDTVLLTCAMLMLTVIGPNHPFILVKIILLCVYIGCGYMTLRVAKTLIGKLIGTAVTLFVFIMIVGVAIYKSPLSWFAA